MKKRKINLAFPHIKLKNLPIKLIIFIIIFLATGFIIGHIGKTLKNSDYFKIKDILVSKGESGEFFYLKGQNIFNIDLRRESGYISEIYPTYKKIRLIRVLPNRIFVDFIRRQPLGLIKLYRYFSVDEDQVLFDVTGELQEIDLYHPYTKGRDLPVILGLETKIFGPKVGKKYNIRELMLALNIIKELNSNRALKDYKFKTVDVTNPTSASLFLQVPLQLSDFSKRRAAAGQEGLEVKIGQYDVKNKINTLSTLLTQIKNELNNIKYIDLRFKEPVIKFKDK